MPRCVRQYVTFMEHQAPDQEELVVDEFEQGSDAAFSQLQGVIPVEHPRVQVGLVGD